MKIQTNYRKQMREEERRLEELMEQTRMLTGKKYAKAAEADQLKQKLQAMTIAEQIKENEINREWQVAREEEVRMIIEYHRA